MNLGKPDARWEKAKAQHDKRSAALQPPVDVRALKTRQLQALHEGRGGKVTHADNRRGVTQIGGGQTCTPSLTANMANRPNALAEISGALAAGRPPAKVNGPGDFRF
jgi:hypothetical protein